jgi:transcription-repair coupling factor (superfamily II helicase)
MEDHHVTQTIAAPDSLADLVSLLKRTEGFDALLSALHEGHSGTVDGAWGSSSALVAATLAREAEHPVLVVLAHPRDLDAWAGDLLSLSRISPAILPAWDNAPGTGPVDEIASQRLRLLKQMQGDSPPRLLLTTFQALIQPVPDRQELAASSRVLRVGDTIDLEEFLSWLVSHGYRLSEAV